MGAAALASRLAVRRNGSAAAAADALDDTLAFHRVGGPLVAVCGLTGGAGASTLAYLLARRAARHSSSPVLLAELVCGGGLTALTGQTSPLGLTELAHAVADRSSVGPPFAQLDDGLRLIAAAHRPEPQPVARESLAGLLGDAHAAHGLVVVDTGPPGPQTDTVMDAASHVLYVLPATEPALRRAELLARDGLFAKSRGRPSALVATALWPGRALNTKQLRALAEPHTDRLLLIPHTPELVRGQLGRAEQALEPSFADLATILRGGR